jgi:hypothetical protein
MSAMRFPTQHTTPHIRSGPTCRVTWLYRLSTLADEPHEIGDEAIRVFPMNRMTDPRIREEPRVRNQFVQRLLILARCIAVTLAPDNERRRSQLVREVAGLQEPAEDGSPHARRHLQTLASHHVEQHHSHSTRTSHRFQIRRP